MKNMMSVDLEDWFCVNNLRGIINYDEWHQCEQRVKVSTHRLLDLFDKYHTTATFFVLGWIADRYPELVQQISDRGHEIASHGYAHLLLTRITPEVFREDLAKSLTLIRQISGQPVTGFRAPSFTVTSKTLWALDIMMEMGITYDSSIFPVGFHPDYGMPASPLAIHSIGATLMEIPLSCAEILGQKIPCSGGGYFRLFPYQVSRRLISACNKQGRPVVFYIHPWEVDPGQPKMNLPALKQFRHYNNLGKTYGRLERLLADFQFTSIHNVLHQ